MTHETIVGAPGGHSNKSRVALGKKPWPTANKTDARQQNKNGKEIRSQRRGHVKLGL